MVARSALPSANRFSALQSPGPRHHASRVGPSRRARRSRASARAQFQQQQQLQQQQQQQKSKAPDDSCVKRARVKVAEERVKAVALKHRIRGRCAELWRRAGAKLGALGRDCGRRLGLEHVPARIKGLLQRRESRIEVQLRRISDRLDKLERALLEGGGTSRAMAVAPAPAGANGKAAEVGGPGASGRVGARAVPSTSTSTSNPRTQKYVKMLHVGIPKAAVIQKMVKEGVQPAELFPDEPSTAAAAGAGAAPAAAAPSTDMRALLQKQIKARNGGAKKAASPAGPRTITPARTVRSDNNSSSSSRGFSLADLQNVRLRKPAAACESPVAPAGLTPGRSGGPVSAADLSAVKLRPGRGRSRVRQDVLKDSTNMQRTTGKDDKASGMAPGLMGDILKVQLRKTTLSRSPGGTPRKGKRGRLGAKAGAETTDPSPSRARSDAEFLELALRRKFAKVHQHSPMCESPGESWLGSSSASKPTHG